MPNRSRNTQRQILPKTPTSPPSHPSLFFSGSEIEPPIGEPYEHFEDPIGEEEEDLVSTEGPASPTTRKRPSSGIFWGTPQKNTPDIRF